MIVYPKFKTSFKPFEFCIAMILNFYSKQITADFAFFIQIGLCSLQNVKAFWQNILTCYRLIPTDTESTDWIISLLMYAMYARVLRGHALRHLLVSPVSAMTACMISARNNQEMSVKKMKVLWKMQKKMHSQGLNIFQNNRNQEMKNHT